MNNRKEVVQKINGSIDHLISKTAASMTSMLEKTILAGDANISLDEWMLLFHLMDTQEKNQKWYSQQISKDKTSTIPPPLRLRNRSRNNRRFP